MEDCVVCGEPVSGEYKCWHGHEYHRPCLKSSTVLKRCLVCDYTVMLPRVAKATRAVGPKKPRAIRCRGKNKAGKHCRNRTHNGKYCHLHTPAEGTEVEEGPDLETAEIIEL